MSIVEFFDERGKDINGNPWIKSKFVNIFQNGEKLLSTHDHHFIMFNPTYLFESSGYTFYKYHDLFYRVK